jgi:hypothetical protein
MFCSSELIFSSTEVVEWCLNVLPVRTRLRRYRGRRVPFSCFARLDSFSAVPRASAPVFMLCAPELLFGCTVQVISRFDVLRARTCFQLYRGRRSHFHVLCSRTSFRRYRRRRVPFLCFALPESFSVVPMASGPVLMFCTPGLFFGEPMASCPVLMFCLPILFFGGTEGVRSRFHVLHARTNFGRYRGRQVHFSFSARPDSFSAVARASGSFFMFCATGLVFDGTEDVRSRF